MRRLGENRPGRQIGNTNLGELRLRSESEIRAGAGDGATSLVSLVRSHALPIGLVMIVAIAMIAPRLWLLTTDPADGARVPISPYGASRIGYDESVYAASMRQVMDGPARLSDPFLANHQADAMQPSSLWLVASGVVARLSGDLFSGLTIISIVAITAALLLLYALLLQITNSRRVAIGLVPIVVMAIQAFNQADGILALRHWQVLRPVLLIDPQRQWHVLLRYPAPVMEVAVFIALVIAAPRAVETGRRGWLIASAVALALLIYSYVYYWTAMVLALIGWGCWMLCERDWQSFRRLALIGGIALLLAMPEFVVLARSAITQPSDAYERLGLDPLGIDTSFVMVVGQRLAIGVPFLAILVAQRSWHERLYIMLFLSPLALASVSGVIPQPWHYRTQTFAVFAVPAFIAGAAAGSRKLPASTTRAGLAILACLAVLAVADLAVFQVRSIQQTDASFVISSDEDAALQWVAGHVSPDETVVSPSIATNLYLAALTPASEYLGEGWSSKATDEELTERMLRAQAAYGYSEDDVFSRLDVTGGTAGFPVNESAGTTSDLERRLEGYLAYFTFQFEITHRQSFAARVQSWRARFRELRTESDVLAPYSADYLYCGPRERLYAASSPSPGTFVRTAFMHGAVVIYRLAAPSESSARPFAGC